jgi:hypothetical protein
LLNHEIGEHLFHVGLMFRRLKPLIQLIEGTKEAAEVVLYDPDALGPQFYQFQENVSAMGEFQDTVQVLELKKVFEVVRGVDAHFPGHLKTGRFWIDVADASNVDVEIAKIVCLKQFEKKLAGPAAPDNGDIERDSGGGLFIVDVIFGHY